MKKRSLALLIAVVLLVGAAFGGTMAYLIDSTDPVTNTFTVGNIYIDFDEETGGEDHEYKMVPGCDIEKDPTITVEKGSEACWLFVKLDKSANFDDFMTYEMAAGWTALKVDGKEVPGVYYREVGAVDADTEFAVIKDNTVSVKDDVTKEAMDALTENTYPTLTVTAYACQRAGFDTPAAAWAEING